MDYNAMRAACSGINPNSGNCDFTCMKIILNATDYGHMMVVTKEINIGYIKIFDEFRGKGQDPDSLNTAKVYFYLKQNGRVDDSRVSKELPHLKDERGIKDEDLSFARLVVLVGGLLVTYDAPLREKLPSNAAEPNIALKKLTS